MWLKLLKLFAALSIYSAAVEPRFVVRNDEVAAIPNLPVAWEGKQIAVFADLQVGMWWANVDAVRRVVGRVVELRPGLVLIAGDFVYEADASVDDQMRQVVELLQPILDDSIPIYAVLGNHDYSLMNENSQQENAVARQVRTALTRAGVHMMDNQVRPLTRAPAGAPGNDTLYLAGIGEKWARNDNAEATMALVPRDAPRIVFMHDPDSFARIPAGAAPLAIAAHTHGMQIGVPYLSDYVWRHFFSDAGSGVEGWQTFGQSGNRLYINRGIGFSVVPARLHAVPELTVFTLTGGLNPRSTVVAPSARPDD
jgi:predicted MPP superfamily phosphohydrolase